MKAIIVNGSPNMNKGNTALISQPFIEGLKSAGAEVTEIFTPKLKINPCLGEYHCWLKKPGECIQNDDMTPLIEQLATAEILVLVTPLYVDGMTGPLKMFLDRIIPIAVPFIELRDDHCRHPGRFPLENGKLVLISNCGFWELDNFDSLLSHAKAISKNLGREFAGALLRPHGGALRALRDQGFPVNDIFDAAREAGEQVVTQGRISPANQKTVSRELANRDQFITIANQYIKSMLDQPS